MQWFLLHCRVYSIYTIHTQCHINLTVFNVHNNSNHHNNNNPQMVYQLVCLPSSASGLLLPITYWMRPWVSLYLSRSRSLSLSLSLQPPLIGCGPVSPPNHEADHSIFSWENGLYVAVVCPCVCLCTRAASGKREEELNHVIMWCCCANC